MYVCCDMPEHGYRVKTTGQVIPQLPPTVIFQHIPTDSLLQRQQDLQLWNGVKRPPDLRLDTARLPRLRYQEKHYVLHPAFRFNRLTS